MKEPFYLRRLNHLLWPRGRLAVILFWAEKHIGHLLRVPFKQMSSYDVVQLASNTTAAYDNSLPNRDWVERTETAYALHEAGFKRDSQRVTSIFGEIARGMAALQKILHYSAADLADTEEELIVKFQRAFSHYLDLYEETFRLLSTFSVICKDLYTNDKDVVRLSNRRYIEMQTREKAAKLSSALVLFNHPLNKLVEGLDRHVRNAISHRRRDWTFENAKVILTDLDGWERAFTYEEFLQLIENLRMTLLAMETAFVIFKVNFEKEMASEGLFENLVYTREEKEAYAHFVARDMRFQVDEFSLEEEESVVLIKLRPLAEKTTRAEANFVSDRQTISVKLPPPLKVDLREQALGFVQRYSIVCGDTKEISIEVWKDNNRTGIIRTSIESCKDFLDGKIDARQFVTELLEDEFEG